MSRVLQPLFVNVTWGAGGCTASKSLELAEICQKQIGLTTCLHLTCTNMRREVIDEALEAAKAMGIRNILALRGDPPREHEYGLLPGKSGDGPEGKGSNDEFTWAIDLVRYIRRVYKDYFCIGVAAYPEGYADESYPTHQSPEHDLPYLLEKVQAGADFIMTQLFYDLDAYLKFEKLLREHESGVFAKIPIIPGLMPIQSFEMLKRITKLSHAKLPDELLGKLKEVAGDDEAVKSVGVEAVSEIIEGIKKMETSTPKGIHFYTLNLEKAVVNILEKCKLISIEKNVIDNQGTSAIHDDTTNDNYAIPRTPVETRRTRRLSSNASSYSQLTSTLENDNTTPASALTPNLTTTPGIGQLPREATWDDYTNGRFGDPRSPAFYAPLSYSPSTLPVPPPLALALWGNPTTISQITSLFTFHLSGHAPAQLPWSESSTLSPETVLVLPQLLKLNARHWWTIASQPAVDGVPSSHPIHGWGPKGGFVFQKAFVEFFLPASEWTTKLRPYLDSPAVRDVVSWYAGDSKGNFQSSQLPHPNHSYNHSHADNETVSEEVAAAAVHAVTWGMFPGKEIATATMVEAVSFRTWAEEAFGLWAEWARVVGESAEGGGEHETSATASAAPSAATTAAAPALPAGSSGGGDHASTIASIDPPTPRPTPTTTANRAQASKQFLKTCAENSMLVNVIGHEFRDENFLWEILIRATDWVGST